MRSPESRERWLLSYADFTTLLFSFFVVLYALSRTAPESASQLPAISASTALAQLMEPQPVLQNASAKPAHAQNLDLDEVHEQLAKAFSREIANGSVALSSKPDGIVLSLREAGFYESGMSTPRPSSMRSLMHVAQILKTSDCDLRVEGHTDSLPIHTQQFSSNWELSTARATSLVRLFTDSAGIDPARLAAAGYAGHRPIASNATAVGRAQNRRVDLIFLASPRFSTRPADVAPGR